jgi:hypothetical protein
MREISPYRASVVSMSGEKPSNNKRTVAAAKINQRKIRFVISEIHTKERIKLNEATRFLVPRGFKAF